MLLALILGAEVGHMDVTSTVRELFDIYEVFRLGGALPKNVALVFFEILLRSHRRLAYFFCSLCLSLKVNEQMLLPPAAIAETTISADNALQPAYTVA